MSQFVKVAKVEELPPGERLWHDLAYETVIVFNVNGRFYAIADLCSHDDGPLEDGELVEEFSVQCPRHGACFDIRTGAALSLPATSPIPAYETKVEDGFVWVADPDA